MENLIFHLLYNFSYGMWKNLILLLQLLWPRQKSLEWGENICIHIIYGVGGKMSNHFSAG